MFCKYSQPNTLIYIYLFEVESWTRGMFFLSSQSVSFAFLNSKFSLLLFTSLNAISHFHNVEIFVWAGLYKILCMTFRMYFPLSLQVYGHRFFFLKVYGTRTWHLLNLKGNLTRWLYIRVYFILLLGTPFRTHFIINIHNTMKPC
jgi:hypothetical protein